MQIKLQYYHGGVLLSSHPIPEITAKLDAHGIQLYGEPYIIAESMTHGCAEWIVKMLNMNPLDSNEYVLVYE